MPVAMRSITNVDPGSVSSRVELSLWPPLRWYGHFILAGTKTQPVIFLFKNRFNTATSLLPADFWGHLVTVLTGIHCILKCACYNLNQADTDWFTRVDFMVISISWKTG